ncbi:MAG: hypothetical protein AB7F22_16435 [Reyranella sp.]|uniref:hypothetical protein n=1 Tax=Reyranella sp. TaxID=1929291 RepID=UPI003D12447E
MAWTVEVFELISTIAMVKEWPLRMANVCHVSGTTPMRSTGDTEAGLLVKLKRSGLGTSGPLTGTAPTFSGTLPLP